MSEKIRESICTLLGEGSCENSSFFDHCDKLEEATDHEGIFEMTHNNNCFDWAHYPKQSDVNGAFIVQDGM